jgi:hypothetical protein
MLWFKKFNGVIIGDFDSNSYLGRKTNYINIGFQEERQYFFPKIDKK